MSSSFSMGVSKFAHIPAAFQQIPDRILARILHYSHQKTLLSPPKIILAVRVIICD